MKLEKTKVDDCTGIRSNEKLGSHVGNIWVDRNNSLRFYIQPNYETQIVIIGENRFEVRFIKRDIPIDEEANKAEYIV